MYLLKENSANTEEPYFSTLPKKEEYLFFPEISVAKWFFESGIAEKNLINNILKNHIEISVKYSIKFIMKYLVERLFQWNKRSQPITV